MPAFDSLGGAKIEAVARYLRVLQGKRSGPVVLPGDARAGKALFFGKAGCSQCHMVGGKGGFIAADLTDYGRAQAVDAIRDAITNPNREPSPRDRGVIVVTRDGQKIFGVARNEDNFSLQLQTSDGAFHLFMKSDLEHVEYQPQSLMPSDYASKLTRRELDDLVSYLASLAAGQKRGNSSQREESERF